MSGDGVRAVVVDEEQILHSITIYFFNSPLEGGTSVPRTVLPWVQLVLQVVVSKTTDDLANIYRSK